jgi:hypothetical protein
MPLLAATATATTSAEPALALLMIVLTVGYLLTCAVWPFRACRHCHGAGRHRGPLRGIRLCRHCNGTGLRLRLGRRVWNAAVRLSRDINRHR